MNLYLNADCMNPETGLPSYPDKYFDLAIVDPPYGIGNALTSGGEGAGWSKMIASNAHIWDIAPNSDYFNELFRVSKNQIIWGGNYFALPPCRMPICWDKLRPNQKNASEWEYAWTSFNGRARLFEFCANGGFILKEPRMHPTQKPIQLYQWLVRTFTKQGDKILDTHVGSASSLVVYEEMGFEYVGYELDADYYRDSCKRLEAFRAQPKLFTGSEIFAASKPPTLF